jgi:hypothetical protein
MSVSAEDLGGAASRVCSRDEMWGTAVDKPVVAMMNTGSGQDDRRRVVCR